MKPDREACRYFLSNPLRRIADSAIYYFFRGNAAIAIIVVALIIIFLWREGVDFFPEHRRHLQLYRASGGELVDFALSPLEESQRLLNDWNDWYQEVKVDSFSAASLDALKERWLSLREEIYKMRLAAEPLIEHVMKVRQRAKVAEETRRRQDALKKVGRIEESQQLRISEVDYQSEEKKLREKLTGYFNLLDSFCASLQHVETDARKWQTQALKEHAKGVRRLDDILIRLAKIQKSCAEIPEKCAVMRLDTPVGIMQALSAFIFGQYWVTQSFWMDWYGLLPVLAGSALVCLIALILAVPVGVGAAIYVSQFASAFERDFIKPALEFIAAIPSVVLGFFGIVVLGESLRALSHLPFFSWVPGFPIYERLNALTAGCLLAFMAVPTIFSLAEDALRNVPKSYREGSLALGATKMQTVYRIVIPTAISGITAAILLGLGRVIGETMVVLLCAGNRLMLPEFQEGLRVISEPVHTMTGIIAQEMPEVVRGSLQYRALFVVGIVLFMISLGINFAVQRLVRGFHQRV